LDKKYAVPALERADTIVQTVAAEPGKLRLIDLSRRLGVHKSSMFSLLHTMEALGWLVRDPGDTYSLGPAIVRYGSAFLKQFTLPEWFYKEAPRSIAAIGETLQLARLDGRDVLYLAKLEAPSPIRIVSEPGMRYPAHATGLGKALLAELDESELARLYPEERLPALTPYTLVDQTAFRHDLRRIRETGISLDLQESIVGFSCVAAVVRGKDGAAEAAASFTMPLHQWEVKQEAAKAEIADLAARLSALIGNA